MNTRRVVVAQVADVSAGVSMDVGFLGHTCAPLERRVLLGFSLEMVSLTDCQVLQVWEENLVPGKSSFIK